MTMMKQWRAELRGLLKQKRSIVNDGARGLKNVATRLKRTQRECDRDRRRIEKATLRACGRVDQRIAVLEGRLAQ